MKTGITGGGSVHAVLGFLGALTSGRGWRLYLLFSRSVLFGVVESCLDKLSRAAVESSVWSPIAASGSTKAVEDGIPRYVAISRWRARRCPSLNCRELRSSSVMSMTVSQSWKPFATRRSRYPDRPNRSRTSVNSGIAVGRNKGEGIVSMMLPCRNWGARHI